MGETKLPSFEKIHLVDKMNAQKCRFFNKESVRYCPNKLQHRDSGERVVKNKIEE
jgi:hypothetical protein